MDLTVGQGFAASAARFTETADFPGWVTASVSGGAVPLSVTYDAASNSYAVSGAGGSKAFGPADVALDEPGTKVYASSVLGVSDDTLILYSRLPGASGPPRYARYVRAGQWTHRDNAAEERLDHFVFGLDTPAAAVPRSGSGVFASDLYGYALRPGAEAQRFEGAGNVNVDFLNSSFAGAFTFSETGLGGGAAGAGTLTASGALSSSGGLSGTASYAGSRVAASGALSGQLYGPGAEELGASFSASGAGGALVSGVMIGAR